MPPQLTFFVELDRLPLRDLFREHRLVELLAGHGVAIALGMLDRSAERASVICALNRAGVPVTAWLLLDRADGYWLTADNARQAVARYRELSDWARREKLRFDGVGLDVEIPLRHTLDLLERGPRAVAERVLRRRNRAAIAEAVRQYSRLVTEIRDDGLRVETYQYPWILDERRTRSSLLQRSLGLVDVGADVEVPMLYESLAPAPWGAAMIDAYGPECQAIGVGVSGGGEPELMAHFEGNELDLDGMLDSLRRAGRYTDRLYLFSLEGCVEQGYLEALLGADLSLAPAPMLQAKLVRAARVGLRALLRAEPLWDLLARLRRA